MSVFGTKITAETIVEDLDFFDSWEERYKYVIDLGKQLPDMSDDLKTDDRIVKGCQSQVWIESNLDNGCFFFEVDSDAFIVKGLLAVVIAAYNGKNATEIQAFDIEAYFTDLDLVKHLSPTRGNGLKAMVAKIQGLAV
jgi:cysteine desulfuration protein SufE